MAASLLLIHVDRMYIHIPSLFAYLSSIYLSTYLSINPPIHPSIHQPIHHLYLTGDSTFLKARTCVLVLTLPTSHVAVTSTSPTGLSFPICALMWVDQMAFKSPFSMEILVILWVKLLARTLVFTLHFIGYISQNCPLRNGYGVCCFV